MIAAAAATNTNWRSEPRKMDRPVASASAPPTRTAPTAPEDDRRHDGAVAAPEEPGQQRQHRSQSEGEERGHGRKHRVAQFVGIDAQLLPGVDLQSLLGVGHDVGGHLPSRVAVNSPRLVDLGQFLHLMLRVASVLPPLHLQLPLQQLPLGLHRQVLPCGHRHRPGNETGDPNQTYQPLPRTAPGHTQDDRQIGHKAVARPEHRRPVSAVSHVPDGAPRLDALSRCSFLRTPTQPTALMGAENCVAAGQAALRYSLMSPSQRAVFTTWRCLSGWSGGSVATGGRWSSERWGRCVSF